MAQTKRCQQPKKKSAFSPYSSKYETEDRILPTLNLGAVAKIRISVDNKNVVLVIGPRDWQWDRKTGELVGSGTCLA